ncbi:TetR/AcrR family transcriptional regulator [Saccharibacillus sacchari]|uniref:TetR/AcrR family transcriptional regulator n=1 Tax=Saccharibacillus sacchari TaxID=456493 RepID=A0ACC6P9D6_9BACL
MENFFEPDRRTLQSKAAFKDALLRLMLQKSFDAVTVTELSASAGLNRGTFYKHYRETADLLSEIESDVENDLVAAFREPYRDRDILAVREMSASAIGIFDHVLRYRNFYTCLIRREKAAFSRDRICHLFKRQLLSDLSTCGPSANIDDELLAGYRAHASFGLIVEWVNSDFKYSSAYMAEQLVRILIASGERDEYRVHIG